MVWSVVVHPAVASWLQGLPEKQYQHALAALDALSIDGPTLGRPFVDTLRGSRIANMKELRPRGSHLRMLFAFDPLRQAVILTGGDKTNQWRRWYEENIAIAEQRFSEHCESLGIGDAR